MKSEFRVTRIDTITTQYVVEADTIKEAEKKIKELPLIQRKEIYVEDTGAISHLKTTKIFKKEEEMSDRYVYGYNKRGLIFGHLGSFIERCCSKREALTHKSGRGFRLYKLVEVKLKKGKKK